MLVIFSHCADKAHHLENATNQKVYLNIHASIFQVLTVHLSIRKSYDNLGGCQTGREISLVFSGRKDAKDLFSSLNE